jgi:uncharacterized delta-60 repeat protein
VTQAAGSSFPDARRRFKVAVVGMLLTCVGSTTDCNHILGIQEKRLGDAGLLEPDFDLSIAESRVRLVRGQSVTVDVSITRTGGFAGTVSVAVTGQPVGVSSDDLEIPSPQTTAVLTLHATTSAVRGSAMLNVYGLSQPVSSRSRPLQLIVQDPSGSPDLTFGGSGRVTLGFGTGGRGVGAGGVKLTPGTGTIVVCGYVRTDSTDSSVMLARLTSDGVLDATFGDHGIALGNSTGSSSDACYSMFLRAGGGINLSGFGTPVGSGTHDVMVGRYTPAGKPDQNTGAGGFATTHFGSTDSFAYALLSGDNDSYIAGGAGPGGALFVRYQKYGMLDQTFGSNGIATIGPEGSTTRWLAQQSSGNIVAIDGSTFRVLRLTQAGRLDTAFANSGFANLDGPGSSGAVILVAGQPKDALLAVGTRTSANGSQDIAVARLSESGQLDTTFGTAGWAIAHFGGPSSKSVVSSAILQDDGAIVIAGQTPTDLGQAFTVVRVGPDGSLDTTFGPEGRQTLYPPDDLAQGITLDDLGRIIVAGTGIVGTPDMSDGIVVYRLWP